MEIWQFYNLGDLGNSCHFGSLSDFWKFVRFCNLSKFLWSPVNHSFKRIFWPFFVRSEVKISSFVKQVFLEICFWTFALGPSNHHHFFGGHVWLHKDSNYKILGKTILRMMKSQLPTHHFILNWNHKWGFLFWDESRIKIMNSLVVLSKHWPICKSTFLIFFRSPCNCILCYFYIND